MRGFRFGLTAEVVINILVLMLVAVGMISLVVVKLTGEVIVRERFQGLKSQVTTIAQALGPLIDSEEAGREGRVASVIEQMEIPGLVKTGDSGPADLRLKDGIRVIVVDPNSLAIPKSHNLICSSGVISRLPGFRSRWTTP